ncbi:MAG: NAD(+) diphosphatase [Cryobacterium sp.]|nr:NAD(+) diphosphatase [Cryobacterium sp.]
MQDALAARSPIRLLGRPPALARGGVDQDHASRRHPALLDELLADEDTRIVVVHRDRGLVRAIPENAGATDAEARASAGLDGVGLELVRPDAVPDALALVYLGVSEVDAPHAPKGTRFMAAVLDAPRAAALAPAERWESLRSIGARLSDLESSLLTQAVAIGTWHADHRYSPISGRPLHPEQAGWVLRGEFDEPKQFPRTDPAVIVAVTDADDRLLLGSNVLWEGNRYSLLSGFVEPGESLESAVVREVFEESGIRVVEPVYLGSQPWPFPRSLMIGFHALADPAVDHELTPDDEEILDLRWFTRHEIETTADIILPGPTSIARRIIEGWLGHELGDDR